MQESPPIDSPEEPQLLGAEPDETPPALSELDQLRQLRRDRQGQREYDFPIPGYRGRLVMRCTPPDAKKFSRVMKRLEKNRSDTKTHEMMIDFLIIACQEIRYLRDGAAESITFQELDPTQFGENPAPITFGDPRLTAALDLGDEFKSARSQFSAVVWEDYAVSNLYGEVATWAGDADEEVDKDLLGE